MSKLAAPALTVSSAWPDTMGLEQAAEYLRLGRDSTRQLYETGILPGVSLNQKHLVFRRAALDQWLASMELTQQKQKLSTRPPACANDSGRGAAPAPSRRRVRPDLSRYED